MHDLFTKNLSILMDNIDKWCLSAETESNLFSVGRVSTIMLNRYQFN